MDFFLREKVGGFSGKGVSEGKRATRGGAASMDAKIHHGCENPYIFLTSMVNFHIHAHCSAMRPPFSLRNTFSRETTLFFPQKKNPPLFPSKKKDPPLFPSKKKREEGSIPIHPTSTTISSTTTTTTTTSSSLLLHPRPPPPPLPPPPPPSWV